MKRCTNCILPETFPNISFDKNTVCNYCHSFKGQDKLKKDKTVYLDKFKKLIGQIREKSDYDCTVFYSGGKDSTYTLYILKKIFKLKVLALVFDNGFLSEQAFRNIDTITTNLGVDCQIIKPKFQMLKKIFRYAASHPMYSPKTLERASTICTSCIALVKFIFLKIALEKQIPMMAWGWSPGQAPLRSSIMKINPALFKLTQEALKKPMKKVVGDEIDSCFLNDEQFKQKESFPYNVSPLVFMEYDEEKIIKKIKELGWSAPKDVDENSTNCLLNSFANSVHLQRYGFHPYVFEIAEMVRTGVMSREKGLKKIAAAGNEKTIKYAKEKLEII